MKPHKAQLVVILTFAGFASTARAQWTVDDPAVHTQQIIGTAQEIAKFVEIINHQVRRDRRTNGQVTSSSLRGPVWKPCRHRSGIHRCFDRRPGQNGGRSDAW